MQHRNMLLTWWQLGLLRGKDDDTGGGDNEGNEEDQPDEEEEEEDDLDDAGYPKGLSDAGKRALDRERERATNAERHNRKLQRELRAKKVQAEPGKQKRDAAKERDEEEIRERERKAAEREARATNLLKTAAITAAATGTLTDPADAARYLDLDDYDLDDEGQVDVKAIKRDLKDLVRRKPYLAAKVTSGAGGRRTGADFGSSGKGDDEDTPKTMKTSQLIRAAAGH